MEFLSTPSARRATTNHNTKRSKYHISIHALCEEGDHISIDRRNIMQEISIHALCEEGDALWGGTSPRPLYFYPRPLRGGRRAEMGGYYGIEYFYPRPLRGGRPASELHTFDYWKFLSTPSARRATGYVLQAVQARIFLSTPSARRATLDQQQKRKSQSISIHALCEEGDLRNVKHPIQKCDFYPRPLRGGRQYRGFPLYPRHGFLSTPSARRATLT